MNIIFEVFDKNGKKIRLTKRQWSHIRKKHPEVDNYDIIEETLKTHDQIKVYDIDETIKYFYKYYKHRSSHEKFLQVVVKYLNGDGFILTAQFKPHIR
ncbi:hypothetical protein HYW75_02020 [Candidatus Pacearchaeota archaeon]|nr:hypothetical protein [Candidatus Pacearchaeota archaeon]